jgi:hypothetical protein
MSSAEQGARHYCESTARDTACLRRSERRSEGSSRLPANSADESASAMWWKSVRDSGQRPRKTRTRSYSIGNCERTVRTGPRKRLSPVIEVWRKYVSDGPQGFFPESN